MNLKMAAMILLMVLVAASASAGVSRRAVVAEESETYVSLTLLAGLGTATDRFGDGDVTRFSAALDYPLVEEFALLARWDHEQTRWDGLLWRSRCMPLLDGSTGDDVFSIGMRINFK